MFHGSKDLTLYSQMTLAINLAIYISSKTDYYREFFPLICEKFSASFSSHTVFRNVESSLTNKYEQKELIILVLMTR